jgi:predicted acylesterase/phospholipase RssA
MKSERFDVTVRHFLPTSRERRSLPKAREAYQASLQWINADAEHSEASLHWMSENPFADETEKIRKIEGPPTQKLDLNDDNNELIDERFKAFLIDVSFPEMLLRKKPDISGWQLRANETQCVIKVWHSAAIKPRQLDAFFRTIALVFGLEPVSTYALALSGGGLRATLFHLGLIRMLRDGDLLKQVSHIVAISGGSILAAHMALNWGKYSGTADEFDEAAAEVIRFARFNVRGRILIKVLFYAAFRPAVWVSLMLGGALRRLNRKVKTIARNSGTWWGSPTFWLSYFYDTQLFNARKADAPMVARMEPEAHLTFWQCQVPKVALLATGMKTGTLCSFTSDGLQIESTSDFALDHTLRASTYPLSLATAASSAFPVFFPPLRVSSETLKSPAGDEYLEEEFLSDGGVFDNSGIRKLAWMVTKHSPHPCFDAAIASDAGAPFKVEHNRHYHSLSRLLVRAPEVLMRRVADLEDENTGQGTIADDIPLIKANIAQNLKAKSDLTVHPILQSHLASIRTDMDAFDPLEIRALIKHGYSVGRAQLLRHFHKTRADRTTVFSFRRKTTRSWDPLPPRNRANSKLDARTNLTSQSAAIYIGKLDISKSRTWFRWALFRQWELGALITVGLITIGTAIGLIDHEKRNFVDQSTTSNLYAQFDNDVATATRSVIAEKDSWQSQYQPTTPNPVPLWTKPFGKSESAIRPLTEQFGAALASNFRQTADEFVTQLDGIRTARGTFKIEYLDSGRMLQALASATQKIDVLKRARTLANAGTWVTKGVVLQIGTVRGGTLCGFSGKIVSETANYDHQPEIDFLGIQNDAKPISATVFFVTRPSPRIQGPVLVEQNDPADPLSHAEFLKLTLAYGLGGGSESFSGDFRDPNLGVSVGRLTISWPVQK